MNKFTLSLVLAMLLGQFTNAQTWTNIASDASGDGANGTLLDGTSLDYYYNQTSDSLWFRITTTGISGPQSMAVGVNVMVQVPGGAASTFNFWGNDNTNPFHKLLTVWVTGNAPSNYSGTIGISNATGVGVQNYSNLSSNNISINVNTTDNTIILGMKRNDFLTDGELSVTSTVNVSAAVGSNAAWNDDIHSSTGRMTITLAPTDIKDVVVGHGDVSVYPNPANESITINTSDLNNELDAISIVDLQGRVVKDVPISEGLNSTYTVPVSDLSESIYFVRLTSGNAIITKRINVSH